MFEKKLSWMYTPAYFVIKENNSANDTKRFTSSHNKLECLRKIVVDTPAYFVTRENCFGPSANDTKLFPLS